MSYILEYKIRDVKIPEKMSIYITIAFFLQSMRGSRNMVCHNIKRYNQSVFAEKNEK